MCEFFSADIDVYERGGKAAGQVKTLRCLSDDPRAAGKQQRGEPPGNRGDAYSNLLHGKCPLA
jgi:hypothetical protein